jgi:hypothetical protein
MASERVKARKAVWQYPPHAGESWRSRKPAETRHVVDRNFGGDVVFYYGRSSYQVTCSLVEWFEWERTAKRIYRHQ